MQFYNTQYMSHMTPPTHIELPDSLIVDLIRWPPSLHSLPLEQVVMRGVVCRVRQLLKIAAGCIIHWLGHTTEVKVHSTCMHRVGST